MSTTEPFDAVDVIRTKRDRGRLSDAQIDWVIDAYTRGAVADEQMSASRWRSCSTGWSGQRSPAGPRR